MTATDLVLTVTQMLRKKGVVGKFVEFFGPGLNAMSVADRATLANMAPEYGATCGLFPIDAQALDLPEVSGRKPSRIALVETYAKAQGMFRTRATPDPVFTDTLELTSARSCLRSPVPSGRRTGCCCPKPRRGFERRDGDRIQAARRRSASATRSRGRTTTSATATW